MPKKTAQAAKPPAPELRTDLCLEFGDGRYYFSLRPIELMRELQQNTGKPLGAVMAAILKGRYVDWSAGDPEFAEFGHLDIFETIRLALIGGNRGEVYGEKIPVPPHVARRLVDSYVIGRPLKEAWQLAAAIHLANFQGRPETTDERAERMAEAPAGASG